MAIETIVAAVRYGSLRLSALTPELRARVEAFQAGQTEGEDQHDEEGEGDQGDD